MLRTALPLLALGIRLTQVVIIPPVANSYAETYPEFAHLAVPYMVATIVALIGIEVALFAGWKSLSVVHTGEFSTSHSMRWVNLMAVFAVIAAVILAGVFAHAAFIVDAGGPPMIFGLFASFALGQLFQGLPDGMWVNRSRLWVGMRAATARDIDVDSV